ncbi:MAG: hypothetical protein KC910_04300 [Candidatus Eremiobacteraeota bacterium]|nr:hypothetical protein [Candidatus Eremiobacteraeota bacterium]
MRKVDDNWLALGLTALAASLVVLLLAHTERVTGRGASLTQTIPSTPRPSSSPPLPEAYTIYCSTTSHQGAAIEIPAHYPQYWAVQGLIERP